MSMLRDTLDRWQIQVQEIAFECRRRGEIGNANPVEANEMQHHANRMNRIIDRLLERTENDRNASARRKAAVAM